MNLLATPPRRRILFAALYLSEGAPIGFIWSALPTLLESHDVPIPQITGLTSLVVLPWTLKFLWAPLIDAFQGPRWGLRHWIMAAQLLMGLTLLPFLFVAPQADLALTTVCLLLHAFCASVQDCAIDALAISVTTPEERGKVNSAMQMGMWTGRALLGGGALVLDNWLGFRGVIVLLLFALWNSLFLVWMSRVVVPDTERVPGRPLFHRARELCYALSLAVRRLKIWLALGYALTAGAAFEGFGLLTGPYLKRLGLEQNEIGWFLAGPKIGAIVLGAIVGGILADRWGRRAANVCGQVLVVLPVLCIALMESIAASGTAGLEVAPDIALVRSVCGLMLLLFMGIGTFTAAQYTLLMDHCLPAIQATQFSAFMAATNACEAWSGRLTGRLVGESGYAQAFVTMAGIGLASLAFLPWLSPPAKTTETPETDSE